MQPFGDPVGGGLRLVPVDEHPDGATVLGAGLMRRPGLYILMHERHGASLTRPVTGPPAAEPVTSPRWSLLQRCCATGVDWLGVPIPPSRRYLPLGRRA